MLHAERPSRPSRAEKAREKIVTAWFDQIELADRAYRELQRGGVDSKQITVAANQSLAKKDLAITEHSKAPEGATTGAVVGAGVGAIAGALALGGSLLIPGIGWIAGPIVGALAAGGAVGVAGGIVGALVGAGMPEHEAKVVEDTVRQGGVVIAVHVPDAGLHAVRKILHDAGGRGLSSD